MRRKDKEVAEPEIVQYILEQAPAIRIAMCDEHMPYIVAMNFGWEPGRIYLHSAMEGRKISILERNSRVAFQTDLNTEIIAGESPCNWGAKYLSLIGSGRACFIETPEEKKHALDLIMSKYSGAGDFAYPSSTLDKTCVIRIDIAEMTGKKSG
ncbi:MAG: pyridoxamine 5'-phosphate oxidase family protein [Syntrophomonadaceae bacterium]